MNQPPHNPDNPDLTAYALGELSFEQERKIRDYLSQNESARSELAGIEEVTDALQHGAPVPVAKLNPAQRQMVLNPVPAPRRMTPMMPRRPVTRRTSAWAPFFGGALRLAAAASIALGAFLLGKHFGAPVSSMMMAGLPGETPAPSAPTESAAPAISAQPEISAPEQAPDTAKLAAAPAPAVEPLAPAPESATAPAEKPPVSLAKVTPQDKPSAPAPAAASKPAPAVAAHNVEDGFVNASRAPLSRNALRPFEVRPAPVKLPAGQALASPLQPGQNRPAPEADSKGRAPDLYIHSWQAEATSCPWNPAHRVLRVAVQLPAEQPASTSPDNSYSLQVNFDPNAVRGYRLLSERNVPASDAESAGFHVVWYEVVPNGAAADASRGKTLATVTMPGARFTTQTVEPFDASKLQALDRGTEWQKARKDFVFETAVVGFGLLLKGEDHLGSLNHDLVLNLARKAQGENPSEEQTRFLKLVQEARRVAGL